MRVYLYITIFGCLCNVVFSAKKAKSKKKSSGPIDPSAGCDKTALYAECDLQANSQNPSSVTGKVYLMQDVTASCTYDYLNLRIDVSNVPANGVSTKRGMHVHKFGRLSPRGCKSMGPHYNPRNKNHGARWKQERHVGDLGNVERLADGTIGENIVDDMAVLYGPESIMNRGLDLHILEDDLGTKGNSGSKTTGNSGASIACCVIRAGPPHDHPIHT